MAVEWLKEFTLYMSLIALGYFIAKYQLECKARKILELQYMKLKNIKDKKG